MVAGVVWGVWRLTAAGCMGSRAAAAKPGGQAGGRLSGPLRASLACCPSAQRHTSATNRPRPGPLPPCTHTHSLPTSSLVTIGRAHLDVADDLHCHIVLALPVPALEHLHGAEGGRGPGARFKTQHGQATALVGTELTTGGRRKVREGLAWACARMRGRSRRRRHAGRRRGARRRRRAAACLPKRPLSKLAHDLEARRQVLPYLKLVVPVGIVIPAWQPLNTVLQPAAAAPRAHVAAAKRNAASGAGSAVRTCCVARQLRSCQRAHRRRGPRCRLGTHLNGGDARSNVRSS